MHTSSLVAMESIRGGYHDGDAIDLYVGVTENKNAVELQFSYSTGISHSSLGSSIATDESWMLVYQRFILNA